MYTLFAVESLTQDHWTSTPEWPLMKHTLTAKAHSSFFLTGFKTAAYKYTVWSTVGKKITFEKKEKKKNQYFMPSLLNANSNF